MAHTLEFRSISKAFPGVQALDDVSIQMSGGKVTALMGENGAGKSTLLKILSGDYQPDSGRILINGEEKRFHSPHQAIRSSVSVIYQERQLVSTLSVAENVFLEDLPETGSGFSTKQSAPQDAGDYRHVRSPIRPRTSSGGSPWPTSRWWRL